MNFIAYNTLQKADTSLFIKIIIILRPASVVHIGNRLKICHCFMMSCMSNALPMQF